MRTALLPIDVSMYFALSLAEGESGPMTVARDFEYDDEDDGVVTIVSRSVDEARSSHCCTSDNCANACSRVRGRAGSTNVASGGGAGTTCVTIGDDDTDDGGDESLALPCISPPCALFFRDMLDRRLMRAAARSVVASATCAA